MIYISYCFMHNQISLTSLFIHIFLNIMIFNKIRNYIWFNYYDIVHSILDPSMNVVNMQPHSPWKKNASLLKI